jgi:hypothetical protein
VGSPEIHPERVDQVEGTTAGWVKRAIDWPKGDCKVRKTRRRAQVVGMVEIRRA